MEKKILSIYVNLQDEKLDLPSYLNGKKFIISICPFSVKSGKFKDIEKVRNLLKKGCLLGQRGYVGRCKYAHEDKTDPWHENFCLYNPTISFEEQLEFMEKGKKYFVENFGKEPDVYAPINHLYDTNTLLAVRSLKYGFFMDKNFFGLGMYSNQGVVIMPEAKIGEEEAERSIGVYCRLDKLNEKKVSDFLDDKELILPFEINSEVVDEKLLMKNEIQKRIRKLERDFRNLED